MMRSLPGRLTASRFHSPSCICALLLLLSAELPLESARTENLELGKQVFLEKAEPLCALFHTLKAAGATGKIGPNLDDLKPDEEKVSNAVKNGVGHNATLRRDTERSGNRCDRTLWLFFGTADVELSRIMIAVCC